MRIRKMKQEDMERVLEITVAAWGNNTLHKLLEDRHGVIDNKGWKERKIADVVTFCRDHPFEVIVAVERQRVVGYATFSINREDSIGNVLNNAVDPACQGKGVGTAMNQWIMAHFCKEGLKIARVSTLAHDKAAQRVYEKQGFKELARSIHYSKEL